MYPTTFIQERKDSRRLFTSAEMRDLFSVRLTVRRLEPLPPSRVEGQRLDSHFSTPYAPRNVGKSLTSNQVKLNVQLPGPDFIKAT